MRRGRLAQALGLRSRHLDRGFQVEAKLLAPGRVARSNDQAVIHALGIAGYEGLRKNDDLGAQGGSLGDQAHGFVHTGFRVEGQGAGLDHGRAHAGLLLMRRHVLASLYR